MKVPHKGLDIRAYVGITLMTLIVVFTFPQSTSKIAANEVVATPTQVVLPPPAPKENYFENLSLTGQGVYVFDITTGKVLFEKNKDSPFPLASITKLMTTVTALEMNHATSSVVISEEDLETEGDTGLLESEEWDLKDLLAYTLVVSSNDGASAIASSMGGEKPDFIKEMNKKAKSIGDSLIFHNESGLDETAELAGGYGTPKDVLKLLEYALDHYPEVVRTTGKPEFTVSSLTGISHSGKNTNILTSKLSSIKAGKTGYSRLAGGNLALIITTPTPNKHDIGVVVLGSNYDDRFSDVEKLVEAAIKTVNE